MIIGNVKSHEDLRKKKQLQQDLLEVEVSNEAEMEKRVKDFKNPYVAKPVPPKYKTRAELMKDVMGLTDAILAKFKDIDVPYDIAKGAIMEFSNDPDSLVRLNALFPSIRRKILEATIPSLLTSEMILDIARPILRRSELAYGFAIDKPSFKSSQELESIYGISEHLKALKNDVVGARGETNASLNTETGQVIQELIDIYPDLSFFEDLGSPDISEEERNRYFSELENAFQASGIPTMDICEKLSDILQDADGSVEKNQALKAIRRAVSNATKAKLANLARTIERIEGQVEGASERGEQVLSKRHIEQFGDRGARARAEAQGEGSGEESDEEREGEFKEEVKLTRDLRNITHEEYKQQEIANEVGKLEILKQKALTKASITRDQRQMVEYYVMLIQEAIKNVGDDREAILDFVGKASQSNPELRRLEKIVSRQQKEECNEIIEDIIDKLGLIDKEEGVKAIPYGDPSTFSLPNNDDRKPYLPFIPYDTLPFIPYDTLPEPAPPFVRRKDNLYLDRLVAQDQLADIGKRAKSQVVADKKAKRDAFSERGRQFKEKQQQQRQIEEEKQQRQRQIEDEITPAQRKAQAELQLIGRTAITRPTKKEREEIERERDYEEGERKKIIPQYQKEYEAEQARELEAELIDLNVGALSSLKRNEKAVFRKIAKKISEISESKIGESELSIEDLDIEDSGFSQLSRQSQKKVGEALEVREDVEDWVADFYASSKPPELPLSEAVEDAKETTNEVIQALLSGNKDKAIGFMAEAKEELAEQYAEAKPQSKAKPKPARPPPEASAELFPAVPKAKAPSKAEIAEGGVKAYFQPTAESLASKSVRNQKIIKEAQRYFKDEFVPELKSRTEAEQRSLLRNIVIKIKADTGDVYDNALPRDLTIFDRPLSRAEEFGVLRGLDAYYFERQEVERGLYNNVATGEDPPLPKRTKRGKMSASEKAEREQAEASRLKGLKKGLGVKKKPKKKKEEDLESESSSEEEEMKKPIKKFKSTRIKVGKGIEVEEEPKYRSFGKYVIHIPQLHNNKLNLKYPKSLGTIPSIKPTPISEEYRDFIIDVLDNGKMSEKELKRLNETEQKHFEKIVNGAGLVETFKLKKTISKDEKEEADRFNLLRGEYLAGNNAPTLLKELRSFILKFMDDGRIKRKDGMGLLAELAVSV